jgi:hypothetical protein
VKPVCRRREEWQDRVVIPGSYFRRDFLQSFVPEGLLELSQVFREKNHQRSLRIVVGSYLCPPVVRRVIEIPLLAKRVGEDEDRSDPFGNDTVGMEK